MGRTKYGRSGLHTAIYGADFETDMNPERTKGWICQWAIARAKDRSSNKNDYTVVHGYTLDEFRIQIYRMLNSKSTHHVVYFHNFAYDIQWMWSLIEELIQEYPDCVTLYHNGPIIFRFDNLEFRDSLRKMPNTTVSEMGELVGLPKLESPRGDFSPGWSEDLTDDDFQYVEHDAAIVALAMKKMHSFNPHTHYATISSDAWHSAQYIFNKAHPDMRTDDCTPFKSRFPALSIEMDAEIRDSYLGGLNVSQDTGMNLAPITHIDRNSMYPTIMSGVNGEMLPYGTPVELPDGMTPDECGYELYIMIADFKFHVKDNRIPILRFKHKRDREMEGVESASTPISDTAEWHHLSITSVDLRNYMRFYDIDVNDDASIRYICFNGAVGDMKEYIDYWYEIKRTAPKGSPERAIAKLMLNSLYGRFGMGVEITDFELVWHDELGDWVAEEFHAMRDEVPGYIPYATFVTAYARTALSDAMLLVCDKAGADAIIHCDTDSVIYKGAPTLTDSLGRTDKLGDWKVESEPVKMIEGGVKRYIEFFKDAPQCIGDMNIKASGVPQKTKHGVPIGMWVELIDDPMLLCQTGTVLGKHGYKVTTPWLRDALIGEGYDPDDMNTMKLHQGKTTRIEGGVVLEETTFKIHDRMEVRFR